MKRLLYALLFLAVLLGGCTDMDMSGFGDFGYTMQNPPAPRPAAPQPQDKPTAELARCPGHTPCPTP